MAVVRAAANKVRKGVVGQDSFYYTGGRQIVRQSRNNSNYGETASRSVAQQSRRVMWPNLVNHYKLLAPWLKKSFGNLGKGSSEYTRFMQLNVSDSKFPLEKSEAELEMVVPMPFTIAWGPLSSVFPLGNDPESGNYGSTVNSPAMTAGMTVGQYATAFITANNGWQNGDNFAVVMLKYTEQGDYIFNAQSDYFELTMNTESTTPLANTRFGQTFTVDGGKLKLVNNEHIISLAFVHTRRYGSVLKCSQAFLEPTGAIKRLRDEANTTFHLQECMLSYGLDPSVLIQPGGSIIR